MIECQLQLTAQKPTMDLLHQWATDPTKQFVLGVFEDGLKLIMPDGSVIWLPESQISAPTCAVNATNQQESVPAGETVADSEAAVDSDNDDDHVPVRVDHDELTDNEELQPPSGNELMFRTDLLQI